MKSFINKINNFLQQGNPAETHPNRLVIAASGRRGLPTKGEACPQLLCPSLPATQTRPVAPRQRWKPTETINTARKLEDTFHRILLTEITEVTLRSQAFWLTADNIHRIKKFQSSTSYDHMV